MGECFVCSVHRMKMLATEYKDVVAVATVTMEVEMERRCDSDYCGDLARDVVVVYAITVMAVL